MTEPDDADALAPDRVEAATAEDVDGCLKRLFGEVPTATGVVHVVAAWRRPDGELHCLSSADERPSSEVDLFVLHSVRARADAIVTTGAVLRAEPLLRHDLGGRQPLAAALAEWRRERLGKERPPVSLVLSSGRDLDLDHPLFAGPTRPVVYTDSDGEWRLESRAADHGVEIAAVDEPSPRGALELLRREFGAATITVEAGASVAADLYADGVVDELLLSQLLAPSLPDAAVAGALPALTDLRRALPYRTPPYRVDGTGGQWRFERYSRSACLRS